MLPSPVGLVAAGVALAALIAVDTLTVADGAAAAVAAGLAWVLGAPVSKGVLPHGVWTTVSGYADTYHRLGTAGLVLFALLLVAIAFTLPRRQLPAVLAVAAGAALAPLEATAPLWLLAGLASPIRRATARYAVASKIGRAHV